MLFKKLTNRLASHAKTIFLVDGIGAAASAFFLGIILTTFESFFGMPKSILIPLSLIAAIFAVYSFSCYFFVKRNPQRFLRIIAFSNIIYCLVTGGMIIRVYEQLTPIGFGYFLGEIVLILSLVFLEFKVLKQKTPF
ncbi:hypothetical protein D3C87_16480 [compost metagenome]